MKQFKKTLSMFLVIVMMFSLFPVNAFATDEGAELEVQAQEAQEQEPLAAEEETPEPAEEPSEPETEPVQSAEPEENAADEAEPEELAEPTAVEEDNIVASGTCGDSLSFVLDSDGLLTISGTGAMADYDYNTYPWYEYSSQIKRAEIGDGVTSVGAYAFYNCTELTEVHFKGTAAPSINSDSFYKINPTIYFPECNTSWANAIDSNPSFDWRLEGTSSYDETIGALLNASYPSSETVTINIIRDVTVEGDVIQAKNVACASSEGTIIIDGDYTCDVVNLPSSIEVSGGLTINGNYGSNWGTIKAKTIALNASLYLGSGGTIITENLKLGSNGSLEISNGKLEVTGTYTGNGKYVRVYAKDYSSLVNSVNESFLPNVNVTEYTVNNLDELVEALTLPVHKLNMSTGADIVLTDNMAIGSNVNLNINGSVSASSDDVAGSITVPTGCTLSNNGSITLSGGEIRVQSGGSFINNGSLRLEGGAVVEEAGANISRGTAGTCEANDNQAASTWSTAIKCGLSYVNIYNKDNYVIDVNLELPIDFQITIDNSTVTIAEDVTVSHIYSNYSSSRIALFNGSTLNIDGNYDGPPIYVDSSSQVLPESKIASKETNGSSSWVKIGLPKATALTITDDGQDVSNQTFAVDMSQSATYQLKAVAQPSGASKNVTWKSSNTAIATVDSNGLVTFVKPGSVTITATTTDGSNKSAKVTFSVYYKDTATSLTAKLDDTSIMYESAVKNGLQVGDSVQMFVYGADKSTTLSAEDFTYISSNKSVATVDDSGIITAQKAGTANITAQMKNDPLNRKVTVAVKVIAVQVAKVSIVPVASSGEFVTSGDGWSLNLEKTAKGSGVRTFTVQAVAKDGVGTELPVAKGKFAWTSSAGNIASVKENADGTATITVNANVDGAVVITATANDLTKAQGTMSVNVMDYTPRLEATSLTIDTQKSGEVSLALVESYGNEINGVELQVYDSRSRSYIASGSLTASYEDNVLTVTAHEMLNNQTIKGQLVVYTTMGEYNLSLNIVVKNDTPNVTVKQSNKFNLFYLDSEAELSVTVAGVDTADIDNIWFDNDALTSSYEPGSGVVTVRYKEGFSGTANGKGSLYISVAGYENAIKKDITVNTVNTKPSLKLTSTSGIINTELDAGYVYTSVYDNTNKKELDLSNVTVTATGTTATVDKTDDNRIEIGSTSAGRVVLNVQDDNWLSPIALNYNISVNTKDPTVKLAKSTLTLNIAYGSAEDSTAITLSQSNLSAEKLEDTVLIPTKATAETDKLDVQLINGVLVASTDDSVKPGNYSYYFIPKYIDTELNRVNVTVKVVNTVPNGRLDKTNISLNSVFSATEAQFAVIPSDSDVEVIAVDVSSTAKEGTAAYENAQKILFEYAGNGIESVKFQDVNDVPANGSYSFKVTATVQNSNGIATMKALNLAVRVVNTQPRVKLSANTLSLNRITDLAGVERASLTVSSATAGYNVVSCTVEPADTNAKLLEQANKIITDTDGGSVTTNLNSGDSATVGNYRFKITPIVEDDDTAQRVELSPVTFTVRVYSNANYSASVSASGSLNVLSRGTGITYTLNRLNNVLGDVNGADLIGKDKDKFELGELGLNAKGQPTVELKLKAGEDYATNVTYSVQLQFTLDSGITVNSPALSLRVTQPGIRVNNPAEQIAYQSQSTSRVITYKLSISSPVGAKIDSADVSIPAALQSAVDEVKVSYADGTATVTVKLKDPSKLTANKSYTIPVTITPANQATNMNATTRLNLTLKAMK